MFIYFRNTAVKSLTFAKFNLKVQVNNITLRKVSSRTSFKEVRIPVPWGHLAGKWWGPKNKQPIFTFHGWQDNCSSFDLLIPRLPEHLSFLALDLPGHGLSSKIPPGHFYFMLADVMLIRRLQMYFNLEKIALMGHSLGAISSYTFAGLFPHTTDFMICLDGFIPVMRQNCVDLTSNNIDSFIKYDAQVLQVLKRQSEPPSYTMEALLEVLHNGTKSMIDKDKCKYLLERAVKESSSQPGTFYFDRDPRLKCIPLLNWSIEDLEEHARRINVPMMVTTTGVSTAIMDLELAEHIQNIIIGRNPKAKFYKINEKHHGHLNKPELYTDIIGRFIEEYDKPKMNSWNWKKFENIFNN